MRYLAIICVCLLCAVSLESQISPGALHRLIGNPSSGVDDPTTWASLVGWYNPTNLFDLTYTSLATANGAIGKWKDQTANGNDFYVRPTGTSVYATNRTDGANSSNYFMVLLDGAGNSPRPYTNRLTLTGNYSISAVIKVFDTSVFNNARLIFNGTSNGIAVLTYKPTGSLTLGSTNGSATISQSTWFVCTITHTNNYTTCYTNNVLYTNNTGEALSPINCFGFGVPSGNTASAGYQELMIFNDELSTAQKLTVYNFFKTKYGL